MIGKALDDNNDIFIVNGSFALIKDGFEVTQHVRTRLLFYTNEWFLDLTAGTPYFEQIFVKPVNLANVESILKQRILETPGVARLIKFAMDFEGGSKRELTVEFEAETIFGVIIEETVEIDV